MPDDAIEQLKSTTFSDRRFTRKQISEIQVTVKTFSNLSRRELGHTICELHQWVTPSGSDKIQSCLSTLEEMEALGLFTLPVKKKTCRGPQKKIIWTDKTCEQPVIDCHLAELGPITLEKAITKDERALWNEFIERYHYLKYRAPMGNHLRYFIVDNKGRKLGCLLFSFATWSLAPRDQWIGWEPDERKKNLKLVLNNNRFLIFPWVNVKCLASKALSIAVGQIEEDWQDIHGYRPVLLETFVDPTKYKGTCYQASNWENIGETQGRASSKETKQTSKKHIYMYALEANFRHQLCTTKSNRSTPKKSPPKLNDLKTPYTSSDPFVTLWQNIITTVSYVAEEFDEQWQKRKRILNTMLIMLFIFRLVFSKNKQGYAITISELWAQCRTMNIPLPQYKPVAASAFCSARAKVDPLIFKTLNTEIIHAYQTQDKTARWKTHRIFAVDGSKIHLPVQLKKQGYRTPSEHSYYPQGLLSCLYQLKSNIPTDFSLVAHEDERKVALTHLQSLEQNDIVIFDRGYFSYVMLHAIITRGLHGVFRLKNKTYKIIDAFIASDETDKSVTIEPTGDTRKKILSKNPSLDCIPLTLRLIKYTHSGTPYVIGTTLIDRVLYEQSAFSDLYHSRWGIEELYKISKELIDVEDFHGQTICGVKQELYAHFVLISIARIFSNESDAHFNRDKNTEEKKGSKIKVNMKNCLITLARNLEALFLQQKEFMRKTVDTIMNTVSRCYQKERPNRSYKRESKKPIKKWRPAKKIKVATVVSQAIAG